MTTTAAAPVRMGPQYPPPAVGRWLACAHCCFLTPAEGNYCGCRRVVCGECRRRYFHFGPESDHGKMRD